MRQGDSCQDRPTPRRRTGPPPRPLGPAERDDLLGRLRRGFGPTQARDLVGISRHRLARERKADPEFAAALKAAEAEGRRYLREEAYGRALAGDREAVLALVPGARAAARQDRNDRHDWLDGELPGPRPPRHANYDRVVDPWRKTYCGVFGQALAMTWAVLADLIPEADRATASARLAALRPGDPPAEGAP